MFTPCFLLGLMLNCAGRARNNGPTRGIHLVWSAAQVQLQILPRLPRHDPVRRDL